MRSLVNQFPLLLPFLVLWFEPFYFSFTLILSPSLFLWLFYQSLSSVSQRSLPFTASFSVICVYGCDSAQNKKASRMHAGILEFSFVYKAQETHSLYPHRHTIKGRFLCVCVCVWNCCVKYLVAKPRQNWAPRNEGIRYLSFLIIILNSTYIELHK